MKININILQLSDESVDNALMGIDSFDDSAFSSNVKRLKKHEVKVPDSKLPQPPQSLLRQHQNQFQITNQLWGNNDGEEEEEEEEKEEDEKMVEKNGKVNIKKINQENFSKRLSTSESQKSLKSGNCSQTSPKEKGVWDIDIKNIV
jgi:hypothetical protein